MFLGDSCSTLKSNLKRKKKQKPIRYREIRCGEIYMFVEISDFLTLVLIHSPFNVNSI